MDTRFFAAVLVFYSACLLGCAAHTASPSATTVKQVTYEVFGMDCPGCHGGLEKNLKKVPGVVDASANWKEQIVTIRFDAEQDLDPARIEKAIRDSNFTPGERLD